MYCIWSCVHFVIKGISGYLLVVILMFLVWSEQLPCQPALINLWQSSYFQHTGQYSDWERLAWKSFWYSDWERLAWKVSDIVIETDFLEKVSDIVSEKDLLEKVSDIVSEKDLLEKVFAVTNLVVIFRSRDRSWMWIFHWFGIDQMFEGWV